MSNYEVEKNRLKSLLGDQYDLLIMSKAIIAGGSITSLFSGKDINDFDIYFRDKASLSIQLAGILSGEYGYFQLHHLTDKALMYIARAEDQPCQLIVFDFFKDAHDIFERFDFTVNMAAFDFETEEFVFHDSFWTDLASRRLNINTNTDYPIITSLRVEKYEKKGYTISKAQHLKLMLAISQMKIDSWEKMRDQVGGMYGYSFEEIFKEDDNQEFSITSAIEKIEALTYGREILYNKSQEFHGNKPTVKEVMEKWKEKLHERLLDWYNQQNETISSSWVGGSINFNSADNGGDAWLSSIDEVLDVTLSTFNKEDYYEDEDLNE